MCVCVQSVGLSAIACVTAIISPSLPLFPAISLLFVSLPKATKPGEMASGGHPQRPLQCHFEQSCNLWPRSMALSRDAQPINLDPAGLALTTETGFFLICPV